MISTHNLSFTKRLRTSLLERGFDIGFVDDSMPLTVAGFSNSFLNSLFAFPYLDFAFVRYEAEVLLINFNGVLSVFGICDSGLLATTVSGTVVLIDEEENIEEVASTTHQFSTLFHLMVHGSTAPVAMQDYAIEQLEEAPYSFWKMVSYALSEGDASPRWHTLTALKDGAIKDIL